MDNEPYSGIIEDYGALIRHNSNPGLQDLF